MHLCSKLGESEAKRGETVHTCCYPWLTQDHGLSLLLSCLCQYTEYNRQYPPYQCVSLRIRVASKNFRDTSTLLHPHLSGHAAAAMAVAAAGWLQHSAAADHPYPAAEDRLTKQYLHLQGVKEQKHIRTSASAPSGAHAQAQQLQVC